MRWLVIADRAEARIYIQTNQGQAMQMITRIEHPEGRLRNQDIKEGRPGRAFESGPQSHQRHAMNTEESPREHDEHAFARHLVGVLDRGRTQHLFEGFILVAEPGFLGEIIARMDKPLKQLMEQAIGKDYMHLGEHELHALFKNQERGSPPLGLDVY